MRRFLFSDNLTEIQEGSIVVIPPFVMHKTEGGPFKRTNLYVGADTLSLTKAQALDHAFSLGCLSLTEEERGEMESLFGKLLSLKESFDTEAEEAKDTLCDYILYRICEISKTKSAAPKGKKLPEAVRVVIDIIEKRYGEKISLAELAAASFISETALCRSFKKHIGCSVFDYITALRITKAKEMLVNTSLSLEEIAVRTGFCSANYLCLVFKKSTGSAPSKYRFKTQ